MPAATLCTVAGGRLKSATEPNAIFGRREAVWNATPLSAGGRLLTPVAVRDVQVIEYVLHAVLVAVEPGQLVGESLLDEVESERQVRRGGHRLTYAQRR